jgi:hypothetical protein
MYFIPSAHDFLTYYAYNRLVKFEEREYHIMEVPLKNSRLPLSGLISFFILASMVLGLALPAAAQDTGSPVNMNVRAAFDGHFKYGEWLPLYVQLENRGSDLNAEIQVRITGRGGTSVFAAPADLPTGSRKLIDLYVLPNNFSHTLEVQLISNNQVITSETVSVKAQPNINYLIGIIAPERGALSMLIGAKLPGMPRKVLLVESFLSDLPSRSEGLRSFDTLIINDVDTSSLTPAQKSSLETWVRQGGRLIIGGGPGALKTTSGLTAGLLPLTPRNFLEVEQLSGLADYAAGEEVRVPGPFVIATGNQADGIVLASQDENPLIIEKTLGAGYINFISLDLTVSPFDAWSGTGPFWDALLAPNGAYPEWMPPDMSAVQMASSRMSYPLSNLPAMDLPSVQGLALLLGIYIVLIGPVNYLLLRWQRKLHWAWVTIPLLTVTFTAGAFGLGYAMRGTDLLLNRILIAEAAPGGTAKILSYYGLFSPTQSSYEIEVSSTGLLRSMTADYDPWMSRGAVAGPGEIKYYQGEPNRLLGLNVNQWSMQSFMSESTWDNFGEIKSNLILDNKRLKGQIINDTGVDLNGVVLILGNQILFIEELLKGEEAQVDLEITDLIGQPYGNPLSYRIFEQEFNKPMTAGPSRELQIKQAVIDSLTQWGSGFTPISQKAQVSSGFGISNAVLLGWFNQAPDDVRVEGRIPAQMTTALLYTYLPYDLPDSDQIVILPGLISGKTVEMPVDGGYCGSSGGTHIYIGRGQAVFDFQIPQNYHKINFHTLNVFVGTEGGWSRVPEASIYDWQKEDWNILAGTNAGITDVAYEEGFIDDKYTVRVKLSTTDGFSGGCYFLGLGLEGDR